MKRFVSLTLASLFLLGALAACSGGTDTPAQTTASGAETNAAATTTEAPETLYIDTLEKRDMNGAAFTIIAESKAGRQTFYMEELEGDVVNDSIHDRDVLVEERLNVTLKTVPFDDRAKCATTVIQAVQANDAAYDMVINNPSAGMNTMTTAGVLIDLLSLPHVTLADNPWWNRSMYDNLQFYGKLYFTSGPIAQTFYRCPSVVAFNKELAADLKIPDLYATVKEGKWTVDAMHGCFKDVASDLNGDGTMDDANDRWAMIVDGTYGNSLFTGAGYSSVQITEAGEYRLTLGDDKSVDLVQKCASLFGDRSMVICDINGSKKLQTSTFKEGRALFCHMTTSWCITLRDMDEDFGILPIPKYTEEQEAYHTCCNTWLPNAIGVPLTNPNRDDTGLIMETMAYYSYGTIAPAIYEVTLYGKTTRDPESAEMLDIIFETAVFDFNTVFNFAKTSDRFRASVIGHEENWTSTWASLKDSAQAELNSMLTFAKEQK